MKQFRISRQPQYFGNNFEVRFLDYDKKCFGISLNVQTIEENAAVSIPSLFDLTKDECIGLMDQLWDLGIRPSNSVGDIGTIEAIKYHLEDFRKLVFKKDYK
jgi:hypothetical protein